MVRNLAKAPLVGVFYAALLWFVAAFLPQSEGYAEATAAFAVTTPVLLMLVVYAVVLAIAYALAFSASRKGGIMFLVMLAISACGLQWVAPALRLVLVGEASGILTNQDILFQLAGGCVATVLSLVLALLLYKTGENPEKQTAKPQPATAYKPRVLGLIIRLLVLPVIFFVVYYLLWYFLLWRVDAVREFYGAAEKLNFMGELIVILTERGWEAAVTLIIGLVYALLSLPILFRLLSKRVMFIAVNVLLYLSAAVRYLIPNPIMPDVVRTAHMIETGALMLVYGVLAGFLLHTAFRKQVPAPAPVASPAPVAQQARPRAAAAAAKPAAK